MSLSVLPEFVFFRTDSIGGVLRNPLTRAHPIQYENSHQKHEYRNIYNVRILAGSKLFPDSAARSAILFFRFFFRGLWFLEFEILVLMRVRRNAFRPSPRNQRFGKRGKRVGNAFLERFFPGIDIRAFLSGWRGVQKNRMSAQNDQK